MVKLCSIPNGARFRKKNQHRAGEQELEYFYGVKVMGQTGPEEGVLVSWDHIDGRRESNPHAMVEALDS